MRIAFDCLGTLMGDKGEALAKTIVKLQELGHECVIWSSLYSYTVDVKNQYSLNCETISKMSKIDMSNNDTPLFDLAVDDDRRQTYLGAKKFLFVDEITNNPDAIVAFILKRAKEGNSNE